MKFNNILNTIGNTPMVELKSFTKNKKIKIYAKLESFNPGGSVKDRIALSMMDDAIKHNLLKKNKIIIEPTSGNTGIALAMISSIMGYKFMAVMPESASIERRKILKGFGAKILLTDGKKGTNYAIEVTRQLVAENPNKYIFLNQFENQANVRAHYQTTGKEIIDDLPSITHFVTGMGTGGTLMGVGKRLKEFNSKIKVVGVEPIAGSSLQGLRNMEAYSPPIFNEKFLDEKLIIQQDNEAFDLVKQLRVNEGISAGISSGASLWGALILAKRIEKGNIVVLFPDSGDKYLSTFLFD